MSSETDTNERRSDRLLFGWTPKRVILAVILFLVSANVFLFVLEMMRLLRESTHIAIGTALFVGVGGMAGVVAAHHRKAGNCQLAMIAYRVAVWCLFAAALQVPNYHQAKDWENYKERQEADEEKVRR